MATERTIPILTVAELIVALQVLPQDAPVYVDDEEGYWPASAPEAKRLAYRRNLSGDLTREVTEADVDHATVYHGLPFPAVFIGSAL